MDIPPHGLVGISPLGIPPPPMDSRADMPWQTPPRGMSPPLETRQLGIPPPPMDSRDMPPLETRHLGIPQPPMDSRADMPWQTAPRGMSPPLETRHPGIPQPPMDTSRGNIAPHFGTPPPPPCMPPRAPLRPTGTPASVPPMGTALHTPVNDTSLIGLPHIGLPLLPSMDVLTSIGIPPIPQALGWGESIPPVGTPYFPAGTTDQPEIVKDSAPVTEVRKEPVYQEPKKYDVDPLAVLVEPAKAPVVKQKVKREEVDQCPGILNVKAKEAGKVTVYSSIDVPKPEKSDKRTLPSDWEERESKTKKKPYFVNVKTGETTWERPVVVKKKTPQKAAASSNTSVKSQWRKWQKTSIALANEEE